MATGTSRIHYSGGTSMTTFGSYRTNNKIGVTVCKGDITKLRCNAIVSYDKEEGSLMVEEGKVTTEGNQTTVLHTVRPRFADFKDEAEWKQRMADTVFECLKRASELDLVNLVLPAEGNVGVDEALCAESYLSAIERFDKTAKTSELKHIIFVDTYYSMSAAMTSALAKRFHIEEDGNQLRVVLVGKVGVGKSATGNSILNRNAFVVRSAFTSVTENSQLESMSNEDFELQVVDTPGLFEPMSSAAFEDDMDNVKKQIIRSLTLLMPGPHVILVVFRGDERFTYAEVSVYREVQNLFPNLFDHMIIVFTHTDSMDSLQELIDGCLSKNQQSPLKQLLVDCNNRYAAIDNTPGSTKTQSQADKLICQIRKLKADNRGNHYSNAILLRCLELMQTVGEGNTTLEEIKREVTAGNDKALQKVHDDPETKSFLQKLSAMCTIL